MAQNEQIERDVAKAAQILRAGGLVACPSETVYGLAARADDDQAVARIFTAKGRPAINPLITHIADMDMARTLAELSPLAEKLADAFWPGPLTLVLPSRGRVAAAVSAGLPTLAIRMPAHPIFRALIAATGLPLAAPSANSSGRLSPTLAAHVIADLGDRVDMILDGGATSHGLESTVIAVTNQLTILRHGTITAEDIEAVIGQPIAVETNSEKPQSPGQLLRHYAPRTPLVLNSTDGKTRLGFGTGGDLDLSPSRDLSEAARNLFAMLAELDAMNADAIHIAPIPEQGIGIAINDRLRRASASVTVK